MWVNHQRTLQAFLVAPILKRQAHKSLSFFGVTAAKVQSLRLHSIRHEPHHQRAPDCSRAPSPLSPCLPTHSSEELVVYTVEGGTKNFQFQTSFGFYCCCDKIVSTKVTERLIWLISSKLQSVIIEWQKLERAHHILPSQGINACWCWLISSTHTQSRVL